MAVTVWITELNEMANMLGGEKVQTPKLHPLAEQVITFTSATNSAAMNSATRAIRIVASGNAHIRIGGTATTSSAKLIANVIEYFGVDPGDVISLVEGV